MHNLHLFHHNLNNKHTIDALFTMHRNNKKVDDESAKN